jgi:parallel beta-helix repeat protein
LSSAANAPAPAPLTYFVRASGDDTHDGLSPATAFAGIRQAGLRLRNPGDRVVVGPGTYREGNISPHGSGTPDAPIAFLADTSGALTGDPAGPVRIVPPNTKTATTGFIVYGRHDIRIEGFEIDGASDAGIQVRPNSRTGEDSTRIALVGNSLLKGAHRGIQVTAAGDVTVTGNTAIGNDVGILLVGGTGGPLHPLVSGNTVQQSQVGIGVERTAGGTVTENELRSSGWGLNLAGGDGLTVSRNTILDPRGSRAFQIGGGSDMQVTDNAFEHGGTIGTVTGTLLFARNRLGVDYGLAIYGERVLAMDNQLGRLYASSTTLLDLERNDGQALQASAGTIIATDNQFTGSAGLIGRAQVELRRNRTASLRLLSAAAAVGDNVVTGDVQIRAQSATVSRNTAASMVLIHPRQPLPFPTSGEGGPFVIEGNACGAMLHVGQSAIPVSTAVVRDNAVDGLVRLFVRHNVQVVRNQARGIGCVLSAPDSRAVLADNASRFSTYDGLIVIGADTAVIENNASSNNSDGGLAVRRSRNLTITGNEFRSNAAGGVSALAELAGDCDRDLTVGVDELVKAIDVAFGQRPLSDCRDADVNRDGTVTIDELVLAVDAALNIPVPLPGSVEIRANRVDGNGRFGIDVTANGPVSAIDNRVVQNDGIPLAVYGRGLPAHTEIIGNTLGAGGAQGLLVEGMLGASIRNNVVFSNREAGILLRQAPDAAVVNNLVYANGNDGIAVGLGTPLPAADALLMNNTLYANAGWGVAIGSPGAPAIGVTVVDNILQLNQRGGIAATVDSLPGLMISFNLNTDGYADGVLPGAHDFAADPRFVAPAGADGVLGGEGFADDDFHLRASDPPSPAIDAGSGPAAGLGITGSAVAGQTVDQGIVDLGYHYGADAP